MIKIEVTKNRISLTGHAMYDDYGKDIVCAAVSSIVITTVNGILSIDKESIKVDENVFTIMVLKDEIIINKLINNMINLLNELSLEYPKNIKIL